MTAGNELYEVLVVRYGSVVTRRSDVFLHYEAYGEPDGPAQLDYYFWIARNEHRTVVIDTGYDVAQGHARGRETFLDPRVALARLAPSPTDVIVTHAHYDHVGNLDAVRGARVHVSEAEYAFWRSDLGDRRLFAMTADDRGVDDLEEAARSGLLTTFAGPRAVAPGIEVIPVGGHTPGQSVVMIDTAVGRVLVASDAVHLDEELELDRPFWICSDLPGMYSALGLIRGWRESSAVEHVLAGHQPGVTDRYPALSGWEQGTIAIIGGRG